MKIFTKFNLIRNINAIFDVLGNKLLLVGLVREGSNRLSCGLGLRRIVFRVVENPTQIFNDNEHSNKIDSNLMILIC